MTLVRWTETALADLESIRDYIRHDSPVLAQLVVTRLNESVGLLSNNPDAGRLVPERDDPALRELIRPPYRVVYERHLDAVVILTIFHSARMFPRDIPPAAR
ncbi:type II toxin-antitoxin system RelE/ParE family toxin [Gemmatimonas sp.]|jgi:toxin ParE1/3/4|uniref:type II toxin-antitoxin system RelE/ParE family toxin n=1 Tax=Gemmatimonas sp. TaxID=1962908 RepID=UPI0037C02840